MAGAIALIVISLGAIVAGRGYMTTARRMRAFAVTRGKVLEKRPIPMPGGDTRTGRWGKGGGYQPYVKYAFEVDAKPYTHDKVSYALHGLKEEIVAQELHELPDEVDVHYDPANPQEAYLKTHTPTIGRWFIVGGSIGLVLGLPDPDPVNDDDLRHLRRCVELATQALEVGDEPFGSLLVSADGEVLFEDHNHVASGDHTQHPEFAIARWAAQNMTPADRAAATVYTSGEHCAMCSAAHGWVGLGRIVIASSTEQLTEWRSAMGLTARTGRGAADQDGAPGRGGRRPGAGARRRDACAAPPLQRALVAVRLLDAHDQDHALLGVRRRLLIRVAVALPEPDVEGAGRVIDHVHELAPQLEVDLRVLVVDQQQAHRRVVLQVAELPAVVRVREAQVLTVVLEPHRVHLDGVVGPDRAQRCEQRAIQQVAEFVRNHWRARECACSSRARACSSLGFRIDTHDCVAYTGCGISVSSAV